MSAEWRTMTTRPWLRQTTHTRPAATPRRQSAQKKTGTALRSGSSSPRRFPSSSMNRHLPPRAAALIPPKTSVHGICLTLPPDASPRGTRRTGIRHARSVRRDLVRAFVPVVLDSRPVVSVVARRPVLGGAGGAPGRGLATRAQPRPGAFDQEAQVVAWLGPASRASNDRRLRHGCCSRPSSRAKTR